MRLADAIAMPLQDGVIIRDNHLPEISDNMIHATLGMRGTGKTSFLYQKMKQLYDGGIGRTRLVYFNFEDERFSDLTLDRLNWVIEGYYSLYPENIDKLVYFFFDEIQHISGWAVFVKNLMQSENIRVYITGSTTHLVRKDLQKEIEGKAQETILYPYSFREALKCASIDIPESMDDISKNKRDLLENRIIKYIYQGGFPHTQSLLELDRTPALQDYVNTVIFKDIVERYGITNINLLKILIRHLLGNTGAHFSVNKFYNNIKSQGIKVAKTTLHEYLDYIQSAFLVYPVYIHTKSSRQRMVNPRKMFAIDPGLAVAYFTQFRPNLENLLATVILIELLRRNAQVTYMITPGGHEVDFIATYPNGTQEAIQVVYDVTDEKNLKKKIRALEDSKEILPNALKSVITLTDEKILVTRKEQFQATPSWKWLLGGTHLIRQTA